MLKELKIDAVELIREGMMKSDDLEDLVRLQIAYENIQECCTLGAVFAELYEAGILIPQSLCDKWGYLS